ncbi:MAG: arsenate reductase ArsC [Desulfobacterales bacterium]|nr:arsenate reductase ArsC [Desulfobacterales bacterium]
MEQKRILVICQHNSGRSQIAEAYLKTMRKDLFVESAGLEPASEVNPLVVKVMLEQGIDLSHQKPQSVFELFKQGKLYDYVITVCDANEEKCPIFAGITKRLHVPFPDPSKVQGTPEQQLEAVRNIRGMIKNWVMDFAFP